MSQQSCEARGIIFIVVKSQVGAYTIIEPYRIMLVPACAWTFIVNVALIIKNIVSEITGICGSLAV